MRFWKCIGTLGVVNMEFGNRMGTHGAIGVICLMFGKCLGTLGGHRGLLSEVWEVYGDPRGS